MKPPPSVRFLQILCVFVMGFQAVAGCTTAFALSEPREGVNGTPTAAPASSKRPEALEERRQRVVEAAGSLVGRARIEVEGQRFPWDCTGVVLAAYSIAGIDLSEEFASRVGNGVARLYEIAVDHNVLSNRDEPQPGDLLFWDDTFDRSRNGRWGDQLTHVAIVVGVDEYGTISFVHHNYRRGIVIETMNLRHPDVHMAETDNGSAVMNSPMRMRRDRHIQPESWLASHLYRNAAELYRITEDPTDTVMVVTASE
ncbi:MAG: CHAP domain-containing protein [Spirochaetaceae bacterium]|nr:MAG: CHAP domain-containing protein [Spirochaetaceae bacterium]